MLAQRKIWSALALLGLVVVAATAAPAPEPKAVTVDDSKWMLPDAEVFFKLNIKQMMSADLMTKGGTNAIKDAIKHNEQLKSVLDATELDVTKDVDTILATGLGTTPKDTKVLIVIRGRFNQDKIHDALEKASKKNDEKLKLVKEGNTQLYEMPAGENNLYAAFAGKDTIVVTQGKETTVDAVKNGGKMAAPLSAGMKSALAAFSGKETMTMAFVVNEDLKKMLAKLPKGREAAAKIQTVTTGLTLTDSVVLAVAGNTGDAKAAKQLATMIEGFKGVGALALGGMENIPEVATDVLNAVKISATKEAVKVDLTVTKEMLDKVAKAKGDK